jgi:hypothetical protein
MCVVVVFESVVETLISYCFLSLDIASCCASIQLVPCDSVNRNKVSIRHGSVARTQLDVWMLYT